MKRANGLKLAIGVSAVAAVLIIFQAPLSVVPGAISNTFDRVIPQRQQYSSSLTTNASHVAIDQANKSHVIQKDSGTTLMIQASVVNPIKASGTVITPLGTTISMDVVTEPGGRVNLTATFGPDSPPGNYTVLVSVVKGPNTSLTTIIMTQTYPQSSSYPALHPQLNGSRSNTYFTGCALSGEAYSELRVVSDSTGAPVQGVKVDALLTSTGCGEMQVIYIIDFTPEQGGWLAPVIPSGAYSLGTFGYSVQYGGKTYSLSATPEPGQWDCLTLHVPSGNVTSQSVFMGPCPVQ